MKQRNISGKDQVLCGNSSTAVKPYEVIETKEGAIIPGFEKVDDKTPVGVATTDQRGDVVHNMDSTVTTSKGIRGAFRNTTDAK